MTLIGNNRQKIKLLLLRPFYGITVHGDMHGDLGISDHHPHKYPDLSLIYAATIAERSGLIDLHVIDANTAEFMPQPEIDGALVGGASLKSDEFVSITRQTSEIYRKS